MKTFLSKFDASKINMESSVKYMVKTITDICEKIGPRAPGSEAEFKAQQYMGEDLKKWSDKVESEEFIVHRQAFMGFIPFTVTMAIIATIVFFTDYPLISFILTILGFIPLVLEFVMYKQFVDPLFIGHTSHNLIATRSPKGEVKKRVILVAHADSQYEWILNYKLGGAGMKAFLIPGVVGLICCSIASLVKGIVVDFKDIHTPETDKFFLIVGIVLCGFIIPYVGFFFLQSYTKSVPGANDNLTGTMASVAIMKYLEDNNIRFENTEVVALAAGSEESGLRGSKAYVKRHLDELKEIPTVFIGLETFRDYDSMAIYARDMTGTVKMDPRVCSLVKKGGELAGVDLPYSSVYVGASDGAAVQKLGVPAVTLASMDPGPPRYYHTRGDVAENMDMKTVEKCLDIALQTLFVYDEEGLKDKY